MTELERLEAARDNAWDYFDTRDEDSIEQWQKADKDYQTELEKENTRLKTKTQAQHLAWKENNWRENNMNNTHIHGRIIEEETIPTTGVPSRPTPISRMQSCTNRVEYWHNEIRMEMGGTNWIDIETMKLMIDDLIHIINFHKNEMISWENDAYSAASAEHEIESLSDYDN